MRWTSIVDHSTLWPRFGVRWPTDHWAVKDYILRMRWDEVSSSILFHISSWKCSLITAAWVSTTSYQSRSFYFDIPSTLRLPLYLKPDGISGLFCTYWLRKRNNIKAMTLLIERCRPWTECRSLKSSGSPWNLSISALRRISFVELYAGFRIRYEECSCLIHPITSHSDQRNHPDESLIMADSIRRVVFLPFLVVEKVVIGCKMRFVFLKQVKVWEENVEPEVFSRPVRRFGVLLTLNSSRQLHGIAEDPYYTHPLLWM